VLGIGVQVRANVALELRLVVTVMMKVQLDLAEAGPSEPGERREIVRGVLLSRKEERVPWRPAVRVPKCVRENGVFSFPTGYAVSPVRGTDPAPERLVVVAHREENVFRPLAAGCGEILECVKAIAPNPARDAPVGESESDHV
jgi:hypothetical protein